MCLSFASNSKVSGKQKTVVGFARNSHELRMDHSGSSAPHIKRKLGGRAATGTILMGSSSDDGSPPAFINDEFYSSWKEPVIGSCANSNQ